MTITTRITRRLLTFARALLHRTHGQDLVEYAMLAGIVTSLAVIAINDIGSEPSRYSATRPS